MKLIYTVVLTVNGSESGRFIFLKDKTLLTNSRGKALSLWLCT